eukprot:SAG31_NODE_12133_length_965_cov_0.949192_1_plen_278_part_10
MWQAGELLLYEDPDTRAETDVVLVAADTSRCSDETQRACQIQMPDRTSRIVLREDLRLRRSPVDPHTKVRTDYLADGCEWRGAALRLPRNGPQQHLSQKEETQLHKYARARAERKRMSMAVNQIGKHTNAHEACGAGPPLSAIQDLLVSEQVTLLVGQLQTKDMSGCTPWHVLCANPELDAASLRALSTCATDAVVEHERGSARTVLHIVAQNNSLSGSEMLRCLHDDGKDTDFFAGCKNILCAQDDDQQTMVHYLCHRSDLADVMPVLRFILQCNNG